MTIRELCKKHLCEDCPFYAICSTSDSIWEEMFSNEINNQNITKAIIQTAKAL